MVKRDHNKLLPTIPYNTGAGGRGGMTIWLPPSHPLVRDTPEAKAAQKLYDEFRRDQANVKW